MAKGMLGEAGASTKKPQTEIGGVVEAKTGTSPWVGAATGVEETRARVRKVVGGVGKV